MLAEGFFRSSLEKLRNPLSPSSPRYLHCAFWFWLKLTIFFSVGYTLCETLQSYAALLAKWDKREQEGEELMKQMMAVKASLPVYFPPGLLFTPQLLLIS